MYKEGQAQTIYGRGYVGERKWMYKSSSDGAEPLNDWVDSFFVEQKLDPNNETISMIGYCVLEVARNGIEIVDGDEVTVSIKLEIKNGYFTATIEDNGTGIKGSVDKIIEENPNHGLDRVRRFADTFRLTTSSRGTVVVFTKKLS